MTLCDLQDCRPQFKNLHSGKRLCIEYTKCVATAGHAGHRLVSHSSRYSYFLVYWFISFEMVSLCAQAGLELLGANGPSSTVSSV